jgi:hypothetical protein
MALPERHRSGMGGIHCHLCGGFIGGDRGAISYQLPMDKVLMAVPRTALCSCEQPVLYEAPPLFPPSPGMPGVGSVQA